MAQRTQTVCMLLWPKFPRVHRVRFISSRALRTRPAAGAYLSGRIRAGRL